MSPICKIILFSLFFISTASCRNKNSNKSPLRKEDSVSVKRDSVILPANFYKRYEGRLGDSTVVLHLLKTPGASSGYFFYPSVGKIMSVYEPSDKISPDSLHFEVTKHDANADTLPPAEWHVVMIGDSLDGVYITPRRNRLKLALREKYNDSSYSFSVMNFMDSTVLLKKDSAEAKSYYSQIFVVPGGVASPAQWMVVQIKNLLPYDSAAPTQLLSFEDIFAANVNASVVDFKKNLPDQATGDSGAWFFPDYYYSERIFPLYNSNGFVSLAKDYSYYSGGAHGLNGTELYNFDVSNKKLLKWNDVFTVPAAALSPVLSEAMHQQLALKPGQKLTEVLFDETVATVHRYYLSSKGIGFWYNPYEIAGYAYGELQVFVPFEKLKGMVRPELVARLQR